MVRSWSGEVSELIAQLIAERPVTVLELLARHADDGNGYCRACTCSLRIRTWPCAVHTAAALAFRSRHP
jgi:hypothetical protein